MQWRLGAGLKTAQYHLSMSSIHEHCSEQPRKTPRRRRSASARSIGSEKDVATDPLPPLSSLELFNPMAHASFRNLLPQMIRLITVRYLVCAKFAHTQVLRGCGSIPCIDRTAFLSVTCLFMVVNLGRQPKPIHPPKTLSPLAEFDCLAVLQRQWGKQGTAFIGSELQISTPGPWA